MDNVKKAVDLLVLVFKLVSGILSAVEGEEKSEDTRAILNGIGGALSDFAETVDEISKDEE